MDTYRKLADEVAAPEPNPGPGPWSPRSHSQPTFAKRRTGSGAFIYLGVFLFILLYYTRPNEWIPGIAMFPVAKVAAAIAALGFAIALLTQPARVIGTINNSLELKGLLLLYGYMWLTLPTAYWHMGSLMRLTTDYWKPFLFVILIAFSVNSLGRLRKLLWIAVVSLSVMAVLITHKYFAGELIGGRAYGEVGGVFDNPNGLALNLVTAIPLCVAFLLTSRNTVSRLWWLACGVCLGVGIFASFSRGGFVALLASAVPLVWKLGVKARRVSVVFLVLLFMLAVIVWFIPSGYGSRLSSIVNPRSDPTYSAQARENLLLLSLKITIQHPLFGVGPGNFEPLSGIWHGTHNTYTQFSAETGIPSLLIFLWILRQVFGTLKRTLEVSSRDRELAVFTEALQVSMVGLVVGILFYHAVGEFFLYFPIGYAVALWQIAQQEPSSSPGVADGFREGAGWRLRSGSQGAR